MSNPTNPKDWIAKAEEDYALALSALRRKRPLTSGATFHAQQLAEKYLKALLVPRQYDPPRIHDLVQVADLCTQQGFILPVSTVDLQVLSASAVQARYPGEDPTVDEARHAFEIAKAVRKFARALL